LLFGLEAGDDVDQFLCRVLSTAAWLLGDETLFAVSRFSLSSFLGLPVTRFALDPDADDAVDDGNGCCFRSAEDGLLAKMVVGAVVLLGRSFPSSFDC
jgi:hypothetical protein